MRMFGSNYDGLVIYLGEIVIFLVRDYEGVFYLIVFCFR